MDGFDVFGTGEGLLLLLPAAALLASEAELALGLLLRGVDLLLVLAAGPLVDLAFGASDIFLDLSLSLPAMLFILSRMPMQSSFRGVTHCRRYDRYVPGAH